MSNRINYGRFEKDRFIKQVRFSKAVLWKSREISLSRITTIAFKPKGVKYVVFEDLVKNERWTASLDELRPVARFKREGQEEQYYFPISVFKKEPIDPSKKFKASDTPRGEKVKLEMLAQNEENLKAFDELVCQCADCKAGNGKHNV